MKGTWKEYAYCWTCCGYIVGYARKALINPTTTTKPKTVVVGSTASSGGGALVATMAIRTAAVIEVELPELFKSCAEELLLIEGDDRCNFDGQRK